MSLSTATTRTVETFAPLPATEHYLTDTLADVVAAVREDVTAEITTYLHTHALEDELIGVMVALCPGNDSIVVEALFAEALTWPVTGYGVTGRDLNTRTLAAEVAGRITAQL